MFREMNGVAQKITGDNIEGLVEKGFRKSASGYRAVVQLVDVEVIFSLTLRRVS